MMANLDNLDWKDYCNKGLIPQQRPPRHELAAYARAAFHDHHLVGASQTSTLVDETDLINQCLMRLWMLQPKEYITTGEVRLRQWAGVDYHEALGRVTFDSGLIAGIYREQYELLVQYCYKPEARLFNELGALFGTAKGHITRQSSTAYALIGSAKYPIELRVVDSTLANRIFRSFHFIHDARENAQHIGLYMAGSELPFSVVAMEPIGDILRAAALAKCGIDYRRSYRFTRLYSAPNAPRNTTSTLLAAAARYLKHKNGAWEACLSSLLPTYGTGSSTRASGFNDILFAREFRHFYTKTPVGYCAGSAETDMPNQTLILPLLELIRPSAKHNEKITEDFISYQ